VKIKSDSFRERLRENKNQRDDEEQTDERERDADEQAAHPRRFAG
jgi:hypothetical protein